MLSSRFIPGNERNITTMIDHLYRAGAEVLYESIHQIHVSGHGFQDELMMMLKACRPKSFVPIHGEYRHLAKHAKLAVQAGVAPENVAVIEDGQVIELDADGKVTRAEKLELQKVAIVENAFMAGDQTIFTQRLNLAKTGIVFAVFLRKSKTHKLAAPPSVSSYGLLLREGEDHDKVLEEAREAMQDVYEGAARKPEIEEILRLEMRRFFRKRASHKPVAVPIILDV
jgi:ribonuclease J